MATSLAIVRVPESPPTTQDVALTIVMPAYNEARTLREAVQVIVDLDLPCSFELIVVDDGSTDDTSSILAAMDAPGLRVFRHTVNRGKGAAVRTGIANARGTHLLVFDADLEYSADDISDLIGPMLDGAPMVYGARSAHIEGQGFRYAVGNRVMTGAANLLFGTGISDLHTCLKLLPVATLRDLHLTEEGFGLDTEITAEMLRRGITPVEVPISYHPRSKKEGKKITWRDGVRCLAILFRVRTRPPIEVGHDVDLDLTILDPRRRPELVPALAN